MNILWDLVDSKEFTDEGKIRVFLTLNCALFGIIGLIIWLIVRNMVIDSLECALCFVGYPAFFFGYFGGFILLCKNSGRKYK